ncbi:MAG: MBL fold metallo-hydrolase [Solobacterium sp.]|nr:MBL fold metallo-hydrolase [Solobacterium sp.]
MKRMVRLTERIYWYPWEEERDRPILGYIKGDNLTMAVDAGHSSAHVQDFYEALKAEGLPLPDVTCITHWHWDHTFGMPFVHGLTTAEERTDRILKGIVEKMDADYARSMMDMDEHIRAEYAEGQEMCVRQADLVFREELVLNCGNCTVQLFHGPSPHTDDCVYVYIPEEKVLFLGDAPCGVWPDWHVDAGKAEEMIRFLQEIDFGTAVSGHWDPQTKDELIRFIRESI